MIGGRAVCTCIEQVNGECVLPIKVKSKSDTRRPDIRQ